MEKGYYSEDVRRLFQYIELLFSYLDPREKTETNFRILSATYRAVIQHGIVSTKEQCRNGILLH